MKSEMFQGYYISFRSTREENGGVVAETIMNDAKIYVFGFTKKDAFENMREVIRKGWEEGQYHI
jgi:hypothetical protein